ncbi:MAG TPA: pilus assembly protein TadG-related protein [Terriglobales bacterium]
MTLPLMVFAIVLVLAMAALAIDVATLYMAKSEAQRAADAAALAAARAFILASTTTAPGDPTAEDVATTLAQQQALAAVQTNNIAGRPGLLDPMEFSFSNPFSVKSNPTVTVKVEQTALPTFFSRIWSRAPNTVSATAMAEAYNPSETASNPAVNVQCVKPFIVPNKDPEHLPQGFVNVDGALINPGRAAPNGTGIVGEFIKFNLDCPACGPGVFHSPNATAPDPSQTPPLPGQLDFVPAVLPTATSGAFCPACVGSSVTQFEHDISCCNAAALACNTATGNTVTVDTITNVSGPSGPLTSGLQCLIHKQPASGMDSLDPGGFPTAAGSPFRFLAGPNNPLVRGTSPVVHSGDAVSTSDSVITLMIYNGPLPVSGIVDIVGYMQVFIVNEDASITPESFTGYILNVSGCGDAARPSAITGGGASPVAVRLIHN